MPSLMVLSTFLACVCVKVKYFIVMVGASMRQITLFPLIEYE